VSKVDTIHYGTRTIRLVNIAKRCWIFADDAAAQLGFYVSSSKLHADAPEDERLKTSLGGALPANLVSVRYLIDRINTLEKNDSPALSKFRAWLKAWKIVNGAKDHSAAD
jgi:prophage antirepressor-like protein